VYVAESLIIGMRDQLQYQRMVDGNESIHRVVDDLSDSGRGRHNVKAGGASLQKYKG
jgi:hypothetical protein